MGLFKRSPKQPKDGPEEWSARAQEANAEIKRRRAFGRVGDVAVKSTKAEKNSLAEKLHGLEGRLIVVTNYAVRGTHPEEWQAQADKLAFGIRAAGFNQQTPITFSIHFQESDSDRARQFSYSASMLEKALVKQGYSRVQASEPQTYARQMPLEPVDIKTAWEKKAQEDGVDPNDSLHIAVISALGLDQLGLDYFNSRFGTANFLSGWQEGSGAPKWDDLADSIEDTVLRDIIQGPRD